MVRRIFSLLYEILLYVEHNQFVVDLLFLLCILKPFHFFQMFVSFSLLSESYDFLQFVATSDSSLNEHMW